MRDKHNWLEMDEKISFDSERAGLLDNQSDVSEGERSESGHDPVSDYSQPVQAQGRRRSIKALVSLPILAFTSCLVDVFWSTIR